MRTLIRIIAMLALATGSLVACGSGIPACAATGPKPQPIKPPAVKPNRPNVNQPTQKRTTSKVQDRTRNQPTTKPTRWSGYNTGRTWSTPYRKGYPVAPQPSLVNDYRSYPGYPGLYPVGVWPSGYGNRYGCTPDREGGPTR